ncbi:MAG TPA: phosphoribosylformylglycinamidine cyclo-ligase [Bryobacterales bacterium]|nr:phosphoribosylformylglycinamidine cyclo-ligase [Bryobacterales bacterium]
MRAAHAITYADAGVNIGEGDRAVARIKKLARRTFHRHVLTDIGTFGAAYSLSGLKSKRPVLVSSADGVGTKLKIAFATGVHDTVGRDLVNHCVNDIAVEGARPLFFLDYLAVGKLDAEVAEQIVSGLAEACCENGCALIGGETAEMPGFYAPGEYDLAGFIVGEAERTRILDGRAIRAGDALLGLPSTGLHTNGYSLARKLLFEVAGYGPGTFLPELGIKAGEELLKVHRSYLAPIRLLLERGLLRGAAHITGGGITGNTPRMLRAGLAARIRLGSWPVLPVFDFLRRIGNVAQDEMMRTFNMGIGMILAAPKASATRAMRELASIREPAYMIGEVVRGKRGVVWA